MRKILLLTVAFIFSFSFFSKGQGCAEPASDGVNVFGYIQPEWNFNFTKDAENNIENTSGFYMRRARLGVMGKIPYDFSYYALAEFSPFISKAGEGGFAYMLDFFVTYDRFGPYFKVSLGQFKSPFGLELTTPCFALHTIYRSTVVATLAQPFRDIGLMFSGGTGDVQIFGLKNPGLIKYTLAITNGTGLNKLDNNLSKDITARLVLAPWEFVSVGGSYRTGKQLFEEDKDDDGQIDISETVDRDRWGVDVQFDFFNFLVQGEYIHGYSGGYVPKDGGCGGTVWVPGDAKSDGYWAMILYNIEAWNLQPVLKYETYDPDMSKPDTDPDNYRRSTITFGLNYFPNDWTRVQINYRYNTESSSSSDISQYNEYPNDGLIVQIQARIE